MINLDFFFYYRRSSNGLRWNFIGPSACTMLRKRRTQRPCARPYKENEFCETWKRKNNRCPLVAGVPQGRHEVATPRVHRGQCRAVRSYSVGSITGSKRVRRDRHEYRCTSSLLLLKKIPIRDIFTRDNDAGWRRSIRVRTRSIGFCATAIRYGNRFENRTRSANSCNATHHIYTYNIYVDEGFRVYYFISFRFNPITKKGR